MDVQTNPLPNRSPQSGQLLTGTMPLPESSGGFASLPTYDLIVIGGGINGTGIARDAALRGLKVLLLEKEDFGSGTSAYSSRLIHGGLRYLANLELDLVYESLSERALLLQNAPHLVRPLALGIPVYKGGHNSAPVIATGMLLYDLLSINKKLPWHRMLGREAFIQRYPGVNQAGLVGGPVYYDAQVDFPELVCVENALSAKETGNASIINHAAVTGFLIKKNEAGGVYFEDKLSQKTYFAAGRVIVNATGPWLDDLLKLAMTAKNNAQVAPNPRIGGTKGSHVIVRRFAGGPETALYVEAQSDGRPFFIIPWRERFYLIGTTDIPFDGNLDQVAANPDEVDYLLTETNRVWPEAALKPEDVLYTYAGVRPLPSYKGRKAGKITRKHWIEDHAKSAHELTGALPGLISVIGGKLTTFRNLARETVNYAIRAYQLNLENGEPVPACQTETLPLPGGAGISDLVTYKQAKIPAASERYGLPEAVISHLIDLYGSRFEVVLKLTVTQPAWKAPLVLESGQSDGKDILAQVVYAVRSQMALTVTDVMLRRIGCGFDEDCGFSALEAVARCMGNELDWDEARIQSEMESYRNWIERRHWAYRMHFSRTQTQAV